MASPLGSGTFIPFHRFGQVRCNTVPVGKMPSEVSLRPGIPLFGCHPVEPNCRRRLPVPGMKAAALQHGRRMIQLDGPIQPF